MLSLGKRSWMVRYKVEYTYTINYSKTPSYAPAQIDHKPNSDSPSDLANVHRYAQLLRRKWNCNKLHESARIFEGVDEVARFSL